MEKNSWSMHEHKSIEEILGEKVKFKDNSKTLYKEIKHNLKLEAVCILACETGEWATEILAYTAGISFQNEIGILGGITAGGTYALYHVYRHAKKHNTESASLIDAAKYVAATEGGCIIGATGSEYAAGKFLAITNNPLTLSNAIIRGVALFPAFAIGLVFMSIFTYNKKKEVARWVGEKNLLKKIRAKGSLGYKLIKDKLEVKGKRSNFFIKEKKLPGTYHKDFDKEKNSLYILQSKIIRSKPGYAWIMQDYCGELFKEAGCSLTFVDNIYSRFEH